MKRLSLKVQIIALTVGSMILLSSIITFVSVTSTTDALINLQYKRLEALRDIKIHAIEKYFSERASDIEVLARSANILQFEQSLNALGKELGVSANGEFPVDNQQHIQLVESHKAFFENYIEKYGYYDLFIISKDHGHVMYSVAFESDYGANLGTGPLQDSGLAEIWGKAKAKNGTVFVDMKPYQPSANAPAMFVGTPVFNGNTISSILVFQIPDNAITEIMGYRNGYGETQEDYLVGSDNLMRSDSYLDPVNHSLTASFANPALGSVDTTATQKALAGESGTEIVIDYNGNPVLSAYSSIGIGDDLRWAIMSEIDEAEILLLPNASRDQLILISAAILVVMLGVSGFIIKFGILNPITRFKKRLHDISEQKDLTLPLDNQCPKELAEMADSVNQFMGELNTLVNDTKRSSTENASVAHELSTSSLGVGSNVERSVAIVNDANQRAIAANEDIVVAVENSREGKARMVESNNKLLLARDEVQQMTQKVDATASSQLKLASEISDLAEKAAGIQSILHAISGIAEQTNLLALNAAIEAARAGEQGRGFAVVADEVRGLAAHTQSSLTEIGTTISTIINAIEDVSANMEKNTEEVQALSSLGQGVDQRINETVEIVGIATEVNDKIVRDFEQTGNVIAEIAGKMENVNAVAAENARSVEEIASAAEHLNTMTDSLSSQLEIFKT